MTIRVCVILGLGDTPGERRLVASLQDDARFELVRITALPRPASPLSGLVRSVLGAERRVFRAHDLAPRPALAPIPFETARQDRYDVVVDFSHGEAAMALAETATEGLWRLDSYAPGAGYGAARDLAPTTEATLWRHRPDGAPEPIATGAYDTKFLATRNATILREKSVQLVIQALARLAVTGSAAPATITPPAPRRAFAARDLPAYLWRANRQLVARGLNEAGEILGRRPGMFFLRVGHGDGVSFDPATGTDLLPPGNCFWADPFLFEHEGALYVFYEEYPYATRRGHISVGRLEGDRLIPLGIALKRPYHLSFPYIFRWQGEILMIPETHAAKRIEVWRATDFPTGWELVSIALDGTETSDNVVFERDGQWWLATNICRDSFRDFNAELHLYRVDSPLLNVVEPHPLNPVVIDTTSARGGGRVFEQDGRLYRSSQDNSHGIYGFGMNLMEITRLDDTHYEERRIRHIQPDFRPDIMACHHMDAAAGRFIIDMRRRALGGPKLGRRKPQ